MVNTGYATFHMYQDRTCQVKTIKSVFYYKATFGEKWPITSFLDSEYLRTPAS